MLINLIPDFFAVLANTDRAAAYRRYFDTHRRLLEAYWHNFVVDPDSQHFADVVQATVAPDRTDLRSMLERTDVLSLARDTAAACEAALEIDVDIDVLVMVGVGAANAGELVVDGRGIAFVCVEHFTAVANPETQGLGLEPELMRLWLAHEIAHAVRYTSPQSRSEMRNAIDAADGYYSYWDTGRRVPLREHLVNEGLAVETARAISPGHAAWDYYGYDRHQYLRVRELESLIRADVMADLDHTGLGLRLRYLSGGLGADARAMPHYELPERTGYYIGARLVERAVTEYGLPWCLRAEAREILAAGTLGAATA